MMVLICFRLTVVLKYFLRKAFKANGNVMHNVAHSENFNIKGAYCEKVSSSTSYWHGNYSTKYANLIE